MFRDDSFRTVFKSLAAFAPKIFFVIWVFVQGPRLDFKFLLF